MSSQVTAAIEFKPEEIELKREGRKPQEKREQQAAAGSFKGFNTFNAVANRAKWLLCTMISGYNLPIDRV